MPQYITGVKAWSVGDVVAGVTVAATSLPQYIAYAELAGLAGHRGITASAPPIVVFAFITGSPCLCIGVTSITALMAHATLRGTEYKEAHGEEAWADLLGAYAVLVGLASLALSGVGAARLASRIPGPVKAGWKLGFAIVVVTAQFGGAVFGRGNAALKASCALPLWGGVPVSGGMAATYRFVWALAHFYLWDPLAAALAVLTLFVVLRGKAAVKRALRLPGLEVIVACVAATMVSLSFGYAGDVVGVAPVQPGGGGGGSPGLASLASWVRRWPWELPLSACADHLGGWAWAAFYAASFAGVDFLAIISVEAEKPPIGGWNPARELAGQGVGCVVSGMAGSAPIGGSLSRSMVACLTGASSPLMGLTSGLATFALAAPCVANILAPVPKAALAAVVLAAVLPGVVRPKDVWQLKSADAAVAWATAFACCLSDPTKGFGVGMALHGAVQLFSKLSAGGRGGVSKQKGQ